jgi:hypothetical protein
MASLQNRKEKLSKNRCGMVACFFSILNLLDGKAVEHSPLGIFSLD